MIKLTFNEIRKLFPQNQEVIFLHAHPDDESFLTAGLIQRLATLQYTVSVFFLCAAPTLFRPLTLWRVLEGRRAGRLLGARQVAYLSAVDRPYRNNKPLDIKILADEFISLREEQGRPFTLVSYDRNGGYGHQDHKQLHQLAQLLQRMTSCKNIEVTINRNQLQSWLDSPSSSPANYRPDISYWQKDFGLPEEEIDFQYELDHQELVKKRNALLCHRTQMSKKRFPLVLSLEDFRLVFGKEYYRVSLLP